MTKPLWKVHTLETWSDVLMPKQLSSEKEMNELPRMEVPLWSSQCPCRAPWDMFARWSQEILFLRVHLCRERDIRRDLFLSFELTGHRTLIEFRPEKLERSKVHLSLPHSLDLLFSGLCPWWTPCRRDIVCYEVDKSKWHVNHGRRSLHLPEDCCWHWSTIIPIYSRRSKEIGHFWDLWKRFFPITWSVFMVPSSSM